MVKVSSSDIVAILRRFELAGDETFPRMIDQIKFSNPGAVNTLVSFRYNKRGFYILFDDTAEDDVAYVTEQVRTNKQDALGEVLPNPQDHTTTYALPFKGKDVYLFAVMSDKKRLDVELAERYPKTSRSTWQKHIKAGHIQVNGQVETSSKQEITENDHIAVNVPEQTDFSASKLPIIYIDDNVIVINKPIGVLTHSKGALNDEFTVAEFFRQYTTCNIDTNRPGIIHRLDRDTSGVLIGARNSQAAAMLQKQFAERTTKKTYIAITDGVPKQSSAKIDLPIGRNPSAPSTFRIDAGGKSAVTTYSIEEVSGNMAKVKLQPQTGRTHQLRVHMAYINCPIHGDRVYGTVADRLYLHARSLEVTLPGGHRHVFNAPVPDEFDHLLKRG